MRQQWHQLCNCISDTLFPRLCVRCGVEGKDVCETCWGSASAVSVGQVCPSCQKASLIGFTHQACSSHLDGLLYLMPYADKVTSGLLRRWKFQFVRSVEKHLENLIRQKLLVDVFQEGDWLVVPVPLHLRRKRMRGFDQAEWIAKTVAHELRFPVMRGLERVRSTAQQSRRDKRSPSDLEKAFRARKPLSGRVILCDDVFTSGATMEGAAKACREAGATSVWGVVIAKG